MQSRHVSVIIEVNSTDTIHFMEKEEPGENSAEQIKHPTCTWPSNRRIGRKTQ